MDYRDLGGRTPLMYAVLGNQPKICEVLLGLGAAVNARDTSGLTPLLWATYHAESQVIRVLLRWVSMCRRERGERREGGRGGREGRRGGREGRRGGDNGTPRKGRRGRGAGEQQLGGGGGFQSHKKISIVCVVLCRY